MAGGLVMLVSTFFLPHGFTIFALCYALIASCATAFGVERIRVPPPNEYRPRWFVGAGNPAWLPAKPTTVFKPRVSIGWIGILLALMCGCLALLAGKYRTERTVQAKRDAAVSQILKLGGTVQQGMVSLAGTKVRDEDLAILRDLDGISSLNLGATNISNAGLKHIVGLTSLTSLTLSGTQVDDAGVTELRALPGLITLRLRQTMVTGTAFPIWSKRMSRVDLSLCPISQAGLQALAQSQFFQLDLSETAIDDEMISQIARFETYLLNVEHTHVTAEAARSIVGPNKVEFGGTTQRGQVNQ